MMRIPYVQRLRTNLGMCVTYDVAMHKGEPHPHIIMECGTPEHLSVMPETHELLALDVKPRSPL
jgi:hypothetical protein